MVQSTALTVEAGAIGGQCSKSPTTFANFQAKADAPGVSGIYLLPKTEYDKLAAASNSDSSTSVFFNYYREFSCNGRNITSCSKSTGNTKLENVINCVAFVNEGRRPVNADLVVNFGESSGLSTGALVGIIIGGLVGAVIVGLLVMRCVKNRMSNRSTGPLQPMSNTTSGPVPPPASALATNLPPDAHLVEPEQQPVAYGNQGYPPTTAPPMQAYPPPGSEVGYSVPSSYGPPKSDVAYGQNSPYAPEVGSYIPPGSQVTPVYFQDGMQGPPPPPMDLTYGAPPMDPAYGAPQYGVPQGQYPPPPPVDNFQGYAPQPPQGYAPQGAYPPPQPSYGGQAPYPPQGH